MYGIDTRSQILKLLPCPCQMINNQGRLLLSGIPPQVQTHHHSQLLNNITKIGATGTLVAVATIHHRFDMPINRFSAPEFNSLDQSLKDTLLRVTGRAWAIPHDSRIVFSFCLRPLLDTSSMPCEPPKWFKEQAVSELKNLGDFDRRLHVSKDRGFLVADMDPWNKAVTLDDIDNGSFMIYKFGSQSPSRPGGSTRVQPQAESLYSQTQRIAIPYR